MDHQQFLEPKVLYRRLARRAGLQCAKTDHEHGRRILGRHVLAVSGKSLPRTGPQDSRRLKRHWFGTVHINGRIATVQLEPLKLKSSHDP